MSNQVLGKELGMGAMKMRWSKSLFSRRSQLNAGNNTSAITTNTCIRKVKYNSQKKLNTQRRERSTQLEEVRETIMEMDDLSSNR